MITQEEEDNRSKTHKLCKIVPIYNFENVNKINFNTEKLTVKCYGLKYFDSKNRFAVLQNNQEESVDQIIERNIETQKIFNTKKHLLKKCRRCNFKNRLCMLDISNCPALTKNCFYCMKGGHYPQSLCCKKKRKAKLRKVYPLHSEIPQRIKIDKNVMELINTRIKQLEPIKASTKLIEENFSVEMIPFLLMYIFLNYDCMFSLNNNAKKEKESKVEEIVPTSF